MKKNKNPQIGELILRKKAKVVSLVISAQTKKIIRELIKAMRKGELVGMAAPQLGYGVRIFVTEIRQTKTRSKVSPDILRVFINPKIVTVSKQQKTDYEGCGSVISGQLFGQVKWPVRVTASAYNEKGKKFQLMATGLLARVIQHETDHLNGLLFIDKIVSSQSLLSRNNYLAYRRKK